MAKRQQLSSFKTVDDSYDRYEHKWGRPAAPIGKGSFGSVCPLVRTDVCVKIMQWKDGQDKETFEFNAVNEIQILHKLRGKPNVVQMVDHQLEFNDNDEMIKAMIFLEFYSYSLSELLFGRNGKRTSVRLTLQSRLEILKQAAIGLMHCHRLNIVHRDIKPDNILCTFSSDYKRVAVAICDFGLARVLDNGTPISTTTTMTRGKRKYQKTETERVPGDQAHSRLCFTTGYRPFELLRDSSLYRINQEVSPTCDVWGYGCLVVDVILGRMLFPTKFYSFEYTVQMFMELLRKYPTADLPIDVAGRTQLIADLETKANQLVVQRKAELSKRIKLGSKAILYEKRKAVLRQIDIAKNERNSLRDVQHRHRLHRRLKQIDHAIMISQQESIDECHDELNQLSRVSLKFRELATELLENVNSAIKLLGTTKLYTKVDDKVFVQHWFDMMNEDTSKRPCMEAIVQVLFSQL